jgi:hypothetical protein
MKLLVLGATVITADGNLTILVVVYIICHG